MFLKLGVQHWGLEIYKVCINGDLGLTLTYLTALVDPTFEWKNCSKVINWENSN